MVISPLNRLRRELQVALGAMVLVAGMPGSAALGQSGLLLGMADGCENADQPCAVRNHTLWIRPHDGRIEAMKIPDLIVPRQDGFWRVGVRMYCRKEGFDGEGGSQQAQDTADRSEYGFQDTWFAGPASEPPALEGLAKGEERDLLDCPKQVTVDHSCGADHFAVVFVNGEYISIDEQADSECGAHPDGEEAGFVGRLDGGIGAKIAYSDMEGAGASDTMEEAAAHVQVENEVGYPQEENTLEEMREKYPKWPSMTDRERVAALQDTESDFCPGESSGEDWYFERDGGKWIAHGVVDRPHVCGGYLTYDLPFEAPFAGPFAGPISMEAIRKQAPDAYDAIWSPNKEMVVVLVGELKRDKVTGERIPTKTSLEVFFPHGEQLGKPAATLPTEESTGPVMAEWATGSNVARWTAELTKIRASRWVKPALPEPRRP
jgi:hypothetical protein